MSTTEKPINIKPEIQAIADSFAPLIKIDNKGVAAVEPDSYLKLLPEGLTKEILVQLQDHNTAFLAGANLAFGEAAIKVMKKNKDLDKIILDVPTTGKDSMSFAITRQQEFKVGDNEPVTKYGGTSVAINLHAGKTRGQMIHVKNLLAEKAFKAFGEK